MKKLVGGATILTGLALAYVFFVPNEWKPIRLPDHQKRRLMVYFGVDYAKHYAGPNATNTEISRARALQKQDSYNVVQAMISVGSGGLTGKGWKNGSQARLEFLPESSTDFIFAVFSEEFGLMGCVGLLTIYFVIFIRSIYIAIQAQDTFSRLLAGSLSFTFFIYLFVNVGMVTGILPVVGVPLPLVSYGGTSMVTLLIGFGILMSVHTHRKLLSS